MSWSFTVTTDKCWSRSNIFLQNITSCSPLLTGCNQANLMFSVARMWWCPDMLLLLWSRYNMAPAGCCVTCRWLSQSPFAAPFDTVVIPTCPRPSAAHRHERVLETYATVEGACFTSRCFGGWIALALHVRLDQMTRLCGSRVWGCTSRDLSQKLCGKAHIPLRSLH